MKQQRLEVNKKVFIIIPDNYFAGGLQKSASSIFDILQKAGFDVTVLCIKLFPEEYSKSYPNCVAISPNYSSKFLFWTAFFWYFRQILSVHRGSCYIALGLFPSVALSLVSIGIKQCRLIGSERIYPPMEKPSAVLSLLRRILFCRFDFVVVQSKRSINWYQKNIKLPASKLTVIPNVVELPRADKMQDIQLEILHESPRPPTVACVGRLVEQKGFDYALRALFFIQMEFPLVRMFIVGEGPLQGYLYDLTIRLGLQDNVSFLSPVSNLAAIWDRVDVFFLPSRYEGFPNVLAEAMSHGLASVAFDCPTGPSDLIDSGKNGFLCTVGDFRSAATLVSNLLRDHSLRRRIGMSAQKVSSTYSRDKVGELWINLL